MLTIDLSGSVTAVIGGARGIGAGICRTVAQAGGNVAWTHLGNEADLAGSAQLTEQVEALGSACFDMAVNCTDEAGTEQFLARVHQRWERLDYLVYCAGFTSPVPFLEVTPDQWREGVDINLNGAFIATRFALPYMQQQGGGAIVLIGSAAIVAGGGGRPDYAAAKAGLEGLNRAITRNFAREQIRCNLVHPSLIDTDLLKQRYPDPAQRAEVAAQVPVGRLGQPEDIANIVVFLLSDKASYITGQSLFVDGGRTFCK